MAGKLSKLQRIQKFIVRQWSGYSWLIIVISIFLNIGFWLLFWQQINYDYNRAVETTSRETMNLVIAFEEHVRRIIAGADKDLLNLKKAYEHEGISSQVIDAYTEKEEKEPDRNQICVVNEQGIIVKSFYKPALATNVYDREYFQVQRTSDNAGLYIGKPIKVRMSGETIIPLSRRINKPDGSFAGIVYIGIKPDYFRSFYRRMDLGENQLISLIGTDWIVRARQSGNNFEVGQDVLDTSLCKNIQNGHSYGTFIAKDFLDGFQRIVSYRVMPDYPLILVVGKETEEAMGSFEKRKHGYILGALLASLFSFAFCLLLVSRAERQLTLNKELSRLERLNVVGEMAAGIGHEIRNPMTIVRGYLQMFQRKNQFAEYREQIDTMIGEMDRANDIITEFLSLARAKSVEIKEGNLNDTIRALFPLLQAEAFHLGHEIQVDLGDIFPFYFDDKEIRQLILNLVKNGLEAMDFSGGILTIKTYLDNGEIILAVQDHGLGIPEEVANKIGTPFVTTKEGGTGLGLSVCYRIAERHKAKITIDSSSLGTTFFVKFKIAKMPG